MGKGSATPERAASGDRVLRKNDSQGRMWYDSMQNAVQRTVIISEILDSRTRHLISVHAPQLHRPDTWCAVLLPRS